LGKFSLQILAPDLKLRRCKAKSIQGTLAMRLFAHSLASVTALSLLMPFPAAARAALVSSAPAANSSVARPARVVLIFNEKLLGPSARVELFMTGMPKGMSHDGGMNHGGMDHSKMDHSAVVEHAPAKIAATSQMGKDGKSLVLMPRRALAPGKYRVNWAAAGADKLAMTGTFNFTVK
jgi:copper resistance protein C